MMLPLNEKEKRELENCLVTQIDFWEERLEQKRGANTESVILDRLCTLRGILEKIKNERYKIS